MNGSSVIAPAKSCCNQRVYTKTGPRRLPRPASRSNSKRLDPQAKPRPISFPCAATRSILNGLRAQNRLLTQPTIALGLHFSERPDGEQITHFRPLHCPRGEKRLPVQFFPLFAILADLNTVTLIVGPHKM